jgi:cytochrome P450
LYSLAGSDTTSIALRSIFYHISKSPNVYAKVMEEVDKAEAEGNFSKLVTYDEAQKLTYLYTWILFLRQESLLTTMPQNGRNS